MCARFAFFSGKIIKDEFGVPVVPDLQPRFNIPPTSAVPAIIETEKGRELRLFQWGLVPSWAKDPAIGARMINARAETLAEKPTFRAAFKRRRCLIPADGFYEWTGDKGRKQPYYITMRTNRTFAFAGLWLICEEHFDKAFSGGFDDSGSLKFHLYKRWLRVCRHDRGSFLVR